MHGATVCPRQLPFFCPLKALALTYYLKSGTRAGYVCRDQCSHGATMRNGQQLLRAWVPDELAERFKDVARQQAGGASAMLRRLIAEALGKTSGAAPRGQGRGGRLPFV